MPDAVNTAPGALPFTGIWHPASFPGGDRCRMLAALGCRMPVNTAPGALPVTGIWHPSRAATDAGCSLRSDAG
jgi:hypothetical protein